MRFTQESRLVGFSWRSFARAEFRQRCLRAPNVPHAKLCGQGPRAEAAAACGLPRARAQTQHVICNLHDAEQVLFGRGASAPGRSRAATASA
jgi:hypothetical protein